MAVHSLEVANGSCDEDGHPKRTGDVWSCMAHIITAVIGSGVLSLAWSTAQLGWIAGPISLLAFAIVTYVSASLLADCYRSPHPVTGTRNYTYMGAVRLNLGRRRTWACGLLQYISMYGTAVAYVITTATSMRALMRSNCYHQRGHQTSCEYGGSIYMLLFGAIQIVMSQIPDFHNMAWLSILAAIMSFCYSFIGLGLGFAKIIGSTLNLLKLIRNSDLSSTNHSVVLSLSFKSFAYFTLKASLENLWKSEVFPTCVITENGVIKGSIGGVSSTASTSEKLFLAFQALGDIAFAYPYSLILLEIQDTLKLSFPPSENKVMKKASRAAIFVTTFFYLCCGCFGYASFGKDTPGNLLTGFGFYEPYWLIDFANACIILHLVGGYQVYSQPIFAFVEIWSMKKHPSNGFINNVYTINLPLIPTFQLNLFKIFWRTIYVLSSVGIAMVFPYFNQVLGVLGALNFWPLAIYFPVEMYFVQRKIAPWTKKMDHP